MAHQVQAEHAAPTQTDGQTGVWPTSSIAATQLSDASAKSHSPTPHSTVSLTYGHQRHVGSDARVRVDWQGPANAHAQPQ